MKHERAIKKTTVFVIWVLLSLPGMMALETGDHLLKHHGRSHHHAKQHATFTCSWMCGAVTPLQSDAPSLSQALPPLAGDVLRYFPQTYGRHFTAFHPGRAPPNSFFK